MRGGGLSGWLRRADRAGWRLFSAGPSTTQYQVAQGERLIWPVFWLMAVAATLYLLSAVIGGPRSLGYPKDLLMLIGGLAVTYGLLKSEKRMAGTLMLLVTLNNTTAFIGSDYGANSPTCALYGISIVLGGLMVGGVFLRLWCAITIVTYAGVTWLGDGFRAEIWPQVAMWSASFLVVAFLTGLFTSEIDRLMADSAKAEERERAKVVEERTRIAREIHDTLAQGFTGVLMQLNAAEAVTPIENLAAHGHLSRARQSAASSLEEARYSIWAIRGGLADAGTSLRKIAEDLTAQTPIRVESEAHGSVPRLSSECMYEIVRIGQEAITNAVRHGRPTVIRVVTRGEDAVFTLTVIDDGVGLTDSPSEGYGFQGMRERAAKIGGRLTISASTDGGVIVEVRVDCGT